LLLYSGGTSPRSRAHPFVRDVLRHARDDARQPLHAIVNASLRWACYSASVDPHAIEEALFRAFISPRRRHRYLSLLESTKGRNRLRKELAHLRDLDMRFARRIPSNEQTAERVERLLRGLGAKDQCLILSETLELDGAHMPWRLALDRVLGTGRGTFLSCVPGRLAYYEGEDPGDRFLLVRNE